MEEADKYQFDSIEVKQTAFRMDGVFVPKDAIDPIYFVEIQFQKDPKIYARLFAEIFLYLSHNPTQLWRSVLIFPSRTMEPDPDFRRPYGDLLKGEGVTVIYLDELKTRDSVGLKTLRLILEPEASAPAQAKELIQQTRSLNLTLTEEQAIIDLIQTIIVYKIPTLSYQEVLDMLGLAANIKDIKVYQQGLYEGKLMAVLPLVKAGYTLQQIAEELDLDIATIAKYLEEHQKSN